jgi:hypothetical protein
MDIDIESLISSREKFNAFVYTSVDEAVNELKRRQKGGLKHFAEENLPIGVPHVFKERNCAVLFRQLATPNYELRRFVSLMDAIDSLTPLFFEYLNDKYTDNNDWKYYLGKMPFFSGKGKKGGEKITWLNVIDFNTSRGKKINEVKTLWGQSLADFHHELFDEAYQKKEKNVTFFDASEWFSKSGGTAKDYYKNFLTLFISHGILFDNFMLDAKEMMFTRDIFLDAFIQVYQDTGGVKPLIVALEPTEVESNLFWFCHPYSSKSFVDKKLSLI